MASRLDLQELLENVLGSSNVHFQPPASIEMKYPAIVYSKAKPSSSYADNSIYRFMHCYELTVIDKDPDSEIPDKVSKLPYCAFDRHYTSDNLYHDVYIIYN